MPFVINTSPATTRNANAILARSFFPRAKKMVYPMFSGSFVSKRAVEPFALIGSVPQVKSFSGKGGGGIRMNAIASYKMEVPNLLWRMGFGISQTDLEFDQTGTIMQLAQAAGIRMSEFPDQLFFKRVMTGSTAASATVNFDYTGLTYNQTFDGVSYYNTAHPVGLTGTQSNIITGSLPLTAAAVALQDIATTAQQLQSDLTQAISGFQTVTDTVGIPLYPNLDPAESVCVIVPPCLREAATLAFATAGSVIAQTTNIYPKAVKRVVSSGYMGPNGFPDPEDPTNTQTVTPVNQTDCFYFIIDDYIKPFYMQLFQPLPNSEVLPGMKWNAEAIVNAVRASDNAISVDAATSFASTRLDTTFNKIGDNADLSTIASDNFFVATRQRGNLVYGPFMTSQKVKPSGGA